MTWRSRKFAIATTAAVILLLLLAAQAFAKWRWGFISSLAIAAEDGKACINGMKLAAAVGDVHEDQAGDEYVDFPLMIFGTTTPNDPPDEDIIFNRQLRIPRHPTALPIKSDTENDIYHYGFYLVYWDSIVEPGKTIVFRDGGDASKGDYAFDIEAKSLSDEEHSEEDETVEVENCWITKKGEYLRLIAEQHYDGNEECWCNIYEANVDSIYNPNLIYPGLLLTLPDKVDLECTEDTELCMQPAHQPQKWQKHWQRPTPRRGHWHLHPHRRWPGPRHGRW
jgi:hypothetical protein